MKALDPFKSMHHVAEGVHLFCNWQCTYLSLGKSVIVGKDLTSSCNGSRIWPRGGGPALIRPKKCVIWASEYNLGPQKWGVRGGPRPPGPPGSATAITVYWLIMVPVFFTSLISDFSAIFWF